jgi:hypothetical protein
MGPCNHSHVVVARCCSYLGQAMRWHGVFRKHEEIYVGLAERSDICAVSIPRIRVAIGGYWRSLPRRPVAETPRSGGTGSRKQLSTCEA